MLDCPSCRVLLVEDEENERYLFRWSLKRLGFDGELIETESAEQARAVLNTSPPPDMVISDGYWSTDGALALTRWIRSKPALKQLPVVVYSSIHSPQNKQMAYEAGADLVVTKALLGDFAERLRPAFMLLPERCRAWLG